MQEHIKLPVRMADPVIKDHFLGVRDACSVDMKAWKLAEAMESEKTMEPVDLMVPKKSKSFRGPLCCFRGPK